MSNISLKKKNVWYMIKRGKDGRKIWNVILGTVSLLLSLGIYQAYITVTIVLVLWLSISDLLEEGEVRDVLKHSVRAIVIVLASGLLYLLAGKVIYAITETKAMARTTYICLKMGNSYCHIMLS